jgi:hypothetical protein
LVAVERTHASAPAVVVQREAPGKAPFLQRLPLLGELKPHHGVCSPAQYAQVFDISDFRRDPHRRQEECGLWKNKEGEAFLLSVVPWFPSFCLPFRTSRSLDSTATPASLSHDPNCVDLRITALSPGKIDPSFQIRAPPNPISTEHPHGLTSSPSSVSCHPRVAHLLL